MADRIRVTVATVEVFDLDPNTVVGRDLDDFMKFRMDDPDCPRPTRRERFVIDAIIYDTIAQTEDARMTDTRTPQEIARDYEDQLADAPDSDTLNEALSILRKQESKGLSKYGATLDSYKGSEVDSLQHAIEEAADLLMYLITAKKKAQGSEQQDQPAKGCE